MNHQDWSCDLRPAELVRPEEYAVPLLNEREKTHGNYDRNAEVSQGIKAIMVASKAWANLTAPQQESLHLIASKIGRILAGGARHADNWRDIAGYAQLIEHRLAPPP